MENSEVNPEIMGDTAGSAPAITLRELITVGAICLLTGLLIFIPYYFGSDPYRSMFYEKNLALIAFLGLVLFTLTVKGKPSRRQLIFLAAVFAVTALYMNLVPVQKEDQANVLSFIHLPLFLWCIYGITYTEFDNRNREKRVVFIRHNGDMVILGGLILLAGMLFAGFTIGLFRSIDISVEALFTKYIGIWGVAAAPAITGFIVYKFPKLTGRIAPVIATLFSPVVLVTLIFFLAAVIFKGKDPYTDRDFLILFNLMLLAVMALTVFSVSEMTEGRRRKFMEWVLAALSAVTLIVDLVALSAIFYRLGEYGITPNRVAVLGSNLLVLGNLILITADLFRVLFRNAPPEKVNITTARYLPLYMAWTVIVTFGFPLIF